MRRNARAVLTALLLVLTSVLTACGQMTGTAVDDPSPIFEDDFQGQALDTAKWNTCHWWNDGGCTIASNDELQWYLPSQVAVTDGRLEMTAEEVETTGADDETFPYRSGMVTTGPPEHDGTSKFDFTYGTVEARVRAPVGVGLWAALWMLPSTEESRPEIDILEVLGNDPNELIMHLHPENRDDDSPSSRWRAPAGQGFDDWRDIRLDWRPEELVYYVDGQEVWRITGEQVPSEPMYLVANLAVGGNYPGTPEPTTEFPATYAVDYVRVWPLAE